jgi:hypothetical protein
LLAGDFEGEELDAAGFLKRAEGEADFLGGMLCARTPEEPFCIALDA